MKKIVLVTNIPTPYRVPLFELLAATLERDGFRLHVVFGATTYGRRMHALDPAAFRFEHTFLDSATVSRSDKEKTTFLYNGLTGVLNRLAPDAVIVSGFSPATLRISLRSIIKGTPYIIWNGSVDSGYRKTGLFKSRMRRWLVSRAKGFIAYGTAAKDYLISIGASSERISIAINTVDTVFFREETERLREQLPSEPVHRLLSIGYLSPRKGTLQLLDMLRILVEKRKDIVLDLVGDGDERAMLEEYVEKHGLKRHVCFHGFIPRERLPAYLAKSEVFLFQTRFDIWGLVLNEAMAAGLPVICSPNAGAARDLLREGETGYIRDFNDPESVAESVDRLLNQPMEVRRIGRNAATFIAEKAGLEECVSGFVAAVRRIL